MATATKQTLAAAATTGNNTHTGVSTGRPNQQVSLNFVVEVAGATPTVTYKLQGSFDSTNGVDGNWVDIISLPSDSETAAVTKVVTAVGAYVTHVTQAHTRAYPWIRLVTSSNTNITYRGELYSAGQQR